MKGASGWSAYRRGVAVVGDGAAGLATAELPLRAIRQSTPYTCGPAALVVALAYLGVAATEAEAAELADTTPAGTPPKALAQAAWAFGVAARVEVGMTVDGLRGALARGQAAIVALQAWAAGGEPDGGYGDDWADGHWVVPCALERDVAVVEDPSVGGRAVLTIAELAERWHDAHSGGRHHGVAVVLRGGRAAPSLRPTTVRTRMVRME